MFSAHKAESPASAHAVKTNVEETGAKQRVQLSYPAKTIRVLSSVYTDRSNEEKVGGLEERWGRSPLLSLRCTPAGALNAEIFLHQ